MPKKGRAKNGINTGKTRKKRQREVAINMGDKTY
jgi:hypothetical protein